MTDHTAQRWFTQINVPIGYFETQEEALAAYRRAEQDLPVRFQRSPVICLKTVHKVPLITSHVRVRRRSMPPGSPRGKVSAATVRNIRSAARQGRSLPELVLLFPELKKSAIRSIVLRESWRHI